MTNRVDRIPGKLERVFGDKQRPSEEKAWGFFAYAYANAFGEMAKDIGDVWPRRQYLTIPCVYLGRHSMELSIRAALQDASELSRVATEPPSDKVHSLLHYWRQLMRQLELLGFSLTDEWIIYCEKIISHMHQHDRNAEHFRYPESRDEKPFAVAQVEFENLVKAHTQVTGCCEAIRFEIERVRTADWQFDLRQVADPNQPWPDVNTAPPKNTDANG